MAVEQDIARTLHATGMPLRGIAERLAQLGHLSSAGKPYHPQVIARWVAPPGPPKPHSPPARSDVPQAPAREPLPALPADAGVEARLARRLADLDALQAEARGEQSYGPAVLAAKTAIALELQIEATRRPPPAEDPTAGMTDDEITAGIVAEVAGWSDDVLDAVEDAIAARRGVRGEGLRVLAGGRQGEA